MNGNNVCMSCFSSVTECYCRKNKANFEKWAKERPPLPVCQLGSYEKDKLGKAWLLFNSNRLMEQVC